MNDPPKGRKTGNNRIRTLAATLQNTYYLEDMAYSEFPLALRSLLCTAAKHPH